MFLFNLEKLFGGYAPRSVRHRLSGSANAAIEAVTMIKTNNSHGRCWQMTAKNGDHHQIVVTTNDSNDQQYHHDTAVATNDHHQTAVTTNDHYRTLGSGQSRDLPIISQLGNTETDYFARKMI